MASMQYAFGPQRAVRIIFIVQKYFQLLDFIERLFVGRNFLSAKSIFQDELLIAEMNGWDEIAHASL